MIVIFCNIIFYIEYLTSTKLNFNAIIQWDKFYFKFLYVLYEIW